MLSSDEKNPNILYLQVLVKPGSKEQKFSNTNNEFQIHLRASPIRGKANSELISYLADVLNLRKSNLKIVRGHKSRDKVISISNCSIDDIKEKLKMPS